MTVCSHPEDGLRCQEGVKPPLKTQTVYAVYAILILTLYFQVHNLPKDLLEKRKIVNIDIANDPVKASVSKFCFT